MDGGGRAGTQEDDGLHRWTRVDVLPPDGRQEVRSSNLLSPTGQKQNSNRSNSEYSSKVQQRRPLGPPCVCSDRYVPLARAAGKTANFSHRSAAFRRATWANSRAPGALTRAAWPRSRSCGQSAGLCLGPCLPMVSALRAPASQDPLPEPAPAIDRCGFADRARGLGTWRRMSPAEPVRCAAPAPGLRRGALRRSHPARAAAPAADRDAVVGWPDHAAAASPPTLGSPAHGAGACRSGSRRGARPRRLPHGQGRRGLCFGSVTVTRDTDGDCDCPACSPGPTQIADYALAVGGMLDTPEVHRTACSGWALPHRTAQAGASACRPVLTPGAPACRAHMPYPGPGALLVVPGACNDHCGRDFGMPRGW
jgi:hypothetical protein